MQENDLFILPGHIWVTSTHTKIELLPTETQLQGRPPGYMQTRLIADYRTKFDRADVQILEHAEQSAECRDTIPIRVSQGFKINRGWGRSHDGISSTTPSLSNISRAVSFWEIKATFLVHLVQWGNGKEPIKNFHLLNHQIFQ